MRIFLFALKVYLIALKASPVPSRDKRLGSATSAKSLFLITRDQASTFTHSSSALHPLSVATMKLAVIAVAMSALSPSADAFAPSSAFNGARMASASTTRASSSMEMSAADDFKKAATGALAVFAGLSIFAAPPAEAITRDTLDSLSYTQVKGTGLANRCPDVVGEESISVSGNAKIVDMCIEPKNFQVLSRVSE